MKKNKQTKILHLPTTVGGNPQGLSHHLNLLDLKSETWAFQQNYFGYEANKVLTKNSDSLLLKEIKRLLALRYVFFYDVVFFNFGQTLFPQVSRPASANKSFIRRVLLPLYRFYSHYMQNLELFLLTCLGRTLFVQYQGDDARQGDYLLVQFPINIAKQVEPGYYSADSDALKRKQIQRITSVCFKTYALNPDLLRVLPPGSEFLPYCHISLESWNPHYTQLESRPLRIGHAPSHRGVKGTTLILDALDALKQKGFEFELVLIEGCSNAEAKERYKTLDILVDQLFAGWYGGLAVEAMALGKPVVVYLRDDDLKFIPSKMFAELPLIRATPDTIQSSIREILEMPRAKLLELAQRSRAYVERWHDPVNIAKRIKADIEQAISAK
jgi:hypothetical protein